jgi:hypothetical protein
MEKKINNSLTVVDARANDSLFASIEPNHAFKWRGELYIKVHNSAVIAGRNSYEVATGRFVSMSDNEVVAPVKLSITVD